MVGLRKSMPTASLNNLRVTFLQADHTPVAPPLKWAGGKRWLLPHLEDKVRPLLCDRRVVEPFCGGLAVSLGFLPKEALLNDVNPHLINFYQWAQRGLTIKTALTNSSNAYYRNRKRFNALIEKNQAHTEEAARLFYYLNRTGYNGLCRFNSRGFFNVPFGKYRTINYTRDFSELQGVIKDWKFTCKDFESMRLRKDDVVYADPPYDVEFTQYSSDGFNWDDQIRLAQWLAKHPGPVILSNQATPRIVKLYRSLGFDLKYLMAPRMISCNGDRSRAREVLAFKNI